MKTRDEFFRDWESDTFGFGYGSGEAHVIGALRQFLTLVPKDGSYDYEALEAEIGPAVAWLLINALCQVDVIEYGTSPRFGWLTPKGEALRDYMLGRDVDQLLAALDYDEDAAFTMCDRSSCICSGDQIMERCAYNPFFNDNPKGNIQ